MVPRSHENRQEENSRVGPEWPAEDRAESVEQLGCRDSPECRESLVRSEAVRVARGWNLDIRQARFTAAVRHTGPWKGSRCTKRRVPARLQREMRETWWSPVR